MLVPRSTCHWQARPHIPSTGPGVQLTLRKCLLNQNEHSTLWKTTVYGGIFQNIISSRGEFPKCLCQVSPLVCGFVFCL